MIATPEARPFVLRDLRLAARVVIAAFLVSVGIGYCSALVQLHFQNASPGRLLPDPDDAAAVYHGRPDMSQLERLLVADESKPFNGSGTMRPAFTARSAGGWKRAAQKKAKAQGLGQAQTQQDKRRILVQAETELLGERNGERLALLDWIRSGAERKPYEEDAYALPPRLAGRPLTEKFVEEGPDGTRRAKIRTILEQRCLRCHSVNVGGPAAEFPLDRYEQVHEYCDVETTGGGMSLKKLAQSTHVHLLGFAMLYGLTGLLFAYTSYPAWARLVLAPLPLLAQVVDIGCWWLGRADPLYARAVVFTGAVVGVTLGLQVLLTLFNLFGARGKVVLAILLLAGCLGIYSVKKDTLDPYLLKEGVSATAPE